MCVEGFKFGEPCAAPTGLGAPLERDPTASAVGYVVSSLTGLERGAISPLHTGTGRSACSTKTWDAAN